MLTRGIWRAKVTPNDPKYKKCKRCGKLMLASHGDYGPECAKRIKVHDGITELFDKEGNRTAVIV